jgi:hypothetical protein
MSENVNPLWDEFILWLAVPVEKRGAIASEDDWAKAKGYRDARQLRRWKKDPRFVARQAELTGESPALGVTSPVFSGSGAFVGDEADYRVVKGQLLDAAKGGNLKATELFMKLYGKSWIDEEAAARSSDFSTVDLDALVAEALVSVAEDQVVSVLRARGWQVKAGEGVPDAGDSHF